VNIYEQVGDSTESHTTNTHSSLFARLFPSSGLSLETLFETFFDFIASSSGFSLDNDSMLLASAISLVAVGAIRTAAANPIQARDMSIIPRQHRSGAVNYDRLPIDCGPKEQAILGKAYNDIDLLINAVLSNRDGGDSSFLTFFGDGYTGSSENTNAFGQIFQNFETVKGLLDDTQRDTVVYITCKDESGRCKTNSGIMAYTNYGPNPQRIVHCPKYFSDTRE
jgi:hypothetical protein